MYYPSGAGEDNFGTAIDFSKETPVFWGYKPFGDQLLPKDSYAKLDEILIDEQLGPDAITNITDGYVPLLRKVYNLEVEDNHTYYVGKPGVLVHNTCTTANPVEKEGASSCPDNPKNHSPEPQFASPIPASPISKKSRSNTDG